MSNMDQAKLPIELISLTLQHLLRTNGNYVRGIGESVQLRLISKAINVEVERILFIDAFLDIEYFRSTDCLQCIRIVRAERPNKALNKITCLRYMVALLGVRDLPKWDMRIKQWTVMKQAVRELEAVPGFVEKILQADARISKEAKAVLDFVNPRGVTAERQLVVSRALADALVTLLGVRNTWANFGPHHDSCGTQVWAKPRTVGFWKLVIASHVGDLDIVKDCLELLPLCEVGQELREARPDVYEMQVQDIANHLSASLTVATRQGHRNIVDHVFAQPLANTQLVLITTKYFNKSSVFCAAINATNHENKAIARVAVITAEKILDLWNKFGRGKDDAVHNERLLMGITPVAPNLFKKAVRRLCVHGVKELSKDLILEIALDGDVEKMRFVLEYLKENPNLLSDRVLTNPSWSDEYGVGLDRMLKRSNPFTIAAALGHVEILRLFKDYLPQVERSLTHSALLKEDNIGSMKQWRSRDQFNTGIHSGIHPVRDAVNDVFVKDNRLPGQKFRKSPPAEALRALLELAPDISWGAEMVACAGLAPPAYVQELVNFVKLDEWFPDKIQNGTGVALDGAKNVTIGERALQHALRRVRPENVKILLAHGAKLAEGTRIANPIFADEKELSEIDELLEVLATHAQSTEDAGVIAWKSRDLSVHYFAPHKEPLSVDEARDIEKDNKLFKWQVGNKSRGTGRPTAFVVESDSICVRCAVTRPESTTTCWC